MIESQSDVQFHGQKNRSRRYDNVIVRSLPGALGYKQYGTSFLSFNQSKGSSTNTVYALKVGAALRPAFGADAPPDVTAKACQVCLLNSASKTQFPVNSCSLKCLCHLREGLQRVDG